MDLLYLFKHACLVWLYLRHNETFTSAVKQYICAVSRTILCTEMWVVLTTNSPDEALGVVSAVVMAHDDMSTTFVEPMARAFTQARISPVVSTVARIMASFEGRNKNALRVVICFMVCDNFHLF